MHAFRHQAVLATLLAATAGLLLLTSMPGCDKSSQAASDTSADGDAIDSEESDADALDAEADAAGETYDNEIDAESEAFGDMPEAAENAENDIDRRREITVASFNLRNGLALDGEDAWVKRLPIVADFVALSRPDVMGTQEGYKYQLDALQEHVAEPPYAWTGISRSGEDFPDTDEYCAIFYRADRYALVDGGTFWLSDTPDVPLSAFSDKQGWVRIATWARLRSHDGDLEFVVFNTHYDLSREDDIPQRSSALIVRKMAALANGLPVVLTGDFNTLTGEDAYLIYVDQLTYDGVRGDLLDPWIELDIPEEGTFHAFTGVATGNRRIDWILHDRSFAPLSAAVEHYSRDGRYPSDHYPVTAVLTTTLP